MKSSFFRLAQFLIYSSINVSVAAALFAYESFAIFNIQADLAFTGFVFFSTMLTYSVHRFIGIAKLDEGLIKGRFLTVKKYRTAIGLTALASLILLLFLALKLSLHTLVFFAISGIICFLYVIPVMHKKKRLRDLPFIKIILIALVWSFVAHIPLYSMDAYNFNIDDKLCILSTLEKFLYIFLITLPFDIRDLELDKQMDLSTFPGKIGLKKSYDLIYILLVIDLIFLISLVILTEGMNIYSYLLVSLSVIVSYLALKLSKGKTSDIYYSGNLDGVIILRSLCILAAFS